MADRGTFSERSDGPVTTVDDSDAMVAVRTLPGAASAVAAALDAPRPASLLGGIAGDDTIFLLPHRGVMPGRMKRELLCWSKKGVTS